MSSSTPQTTVNRAHLHRETLRILNANSFHFIPISLLFLPITFSASAAVQSYFSFFSSFDPLTLLFIKTITASFQTLLSVKTLIAVLAFTLLVILPTVAGIALITYSAKQVIYHQRLTFSSTVKSLSRSYIPVLSTIIAGSIKLILLSMLFTLSAFGTTEAIKSLGFNPDQFFVSIFIHIIASDALALTIVFFLVIWGSSVAIAVLESKSGFESLRQSANQLTDFRSHSFSILFISGIVILSLMLINSVIVQNIGPATNWVSILLVCAICLQSSLMILQYVVGSTVLYVQYKVARGEETVKTAVEDEVSGEYASVVVNDEDEKVPHQLPKADANGGFTYMMCFFLAFWFVISPIIITLY